MRVHYLQHEPFEGLGSMAKWFETHPATLAATHIYHADASLPDSNDFDWLILMGGGMSVHDEDALPWLRPEKEFVRQAIDRGKIVLGVCLGAQMIAAALGARVFKNPVKEIGWFPVTREPEAENHRLGQVLPEVTEVFHWHGETFDLPEGATRLARSAGCLNQAFVWGERVVGLQFHLETTLESARELIAGCPADLVPGPFVQMPSAMLSNPERFDTLNGLMARLLEALAGGGVDSSSVH